LADQIRNKKPKQEEPAPDLLLVPSGSTLLNLACSDSSDGAFATGTMVNMIGDSSAGKSFEALTMLAEVAHIELFDEYRLIYDDAEHASQFDITTLFGEKTAERIEPPELDDDGEPLPSDTIQDFQSNVMKAFEKKKPFIYVLDSFDAVTSVEEQAKLKKTMDARKKGEKAAGSYGMEKAKISGQILRMIVSQLKRSHSFILIVSQTRENIDPTSFTKKTRSGGRALKFYASHEIWLAVAKKHSKGPEKRKRMIGIDCKAKVSKNKLTGKLRNVEFPIFYSYGIDDIGSCVDFLVQEGHWKTSKLSIIVPEMKFKGNRASLIKKIETSPRNVARLQKLTERVWNKIEASLNLNRKRRYE